MSEEDVGIESSVEGPKQRIVVEMSSQKMFDTYPNGAETWFYAQLVEKMPSGELKDAIVSAKKERENRLKKNPESIYYSEFINNKSRDYAFRAYKRKSDGTAHWEHSEATVHKAQDNIHSKGIETAMDGDSYKMLMPGIIWDMYLLPLPRDIEDGLDLSTILVYRNAPYVLPSADEKTILVDINAGNESDVETAILTKDAREQGIPTLRDNLIGQVDIQWINDSRPDRKLLKKLIRKARSRK